MPLGRAVIMGHVFDIRFPPDNFMIGLYDKVLAGVHDGRRGDVRDE